MSDIGTKDLLVSHAVAEAIREVRLKKRMSQSLLATTSGLSESAIEEIESKARPVSWGELHKLEHGFGKDGAKLIAKVVLRRMQEDPERRAFAIETMSRAIVNLEMALKDDGSNSNEETVQ